MAVFFGYRLAVRVSSSWRGISGYWIDCDTFSGQFLCHGLDVINSLFSRVSVMMVGSI